MSLFEDKDIFEIENDSTESFAKFLAENDHRGITIVPEIDRDGQSLVLPPEASDFAKWIRQRPVDVPVQTLSADGHAIRRSAEIWLPLVFLASDVTLAVYLNLVSSYLYDVLRGRLKGDKDRVHLSASYVDNEAGIAKRFNFVGDVESFHKISTKFNANKFFDG